jgi:murein L,D-transpeptidase YcbB/YkuD
MTGWAEPDGMARFRSDIYGLDKGTRLPTAHETPMALRR